MVKLNNLVQYVFYLATSLALLANTNITFLIHNRNLNIVFLVLMFVVYVYYAKSRLFTKDMLFSTIFLVIYFAFFLVFRIQLTINWSLIFFLFFTPLISSNDIHFVRNLLIIKIALISMVILACLMGMIPDTVTYKIGEEAHSLGFFHPNTLGVTGLSILYDLYILSKTKRTIFYALITVVAVVILYRITYSRTSLMIMLTILIIFIFRDWLSKKIVSRVCFVLLTMLIILVGLFDSVFYTTSNQIYVFIDKFLTNRLYLGNLYINRYGFTLLPKQTPNIIPTGWWSSDQLFNDNTYLKFALTQGTILTAVLILYILYNVFSKKYNLYRALLMTTAFIYLIIEAQDFNVFLFTPLLFNLMAESDGTGSLE